MTKWNYNIKVHDWFKIPLEEQLIILEKYYPIGMNFAHYNANDIIFKVLEYKEKEYERKGNSLFIIVEVIKGQERLIPKNDNIVSLNPSNLRPIKSEMISYGLNILGI